MCWITATERQEERNDRWRTHPHPTASLDSSRKLTSTFRVTCNYSIRKNVPANNDQDTTGHASLNTPAILGRVTSSYNDIKSTDLASQVTPMETQERKLQTRTQNPAATVRQYPRPFRRRRTEPQHPNDQFPRRNRSRLPSDVSKQEISRIIAKTLENLYHTKGSSQHMKIEAATDVSR